MAFFVDLLPSPPTLEVDALSDGDVAMVLRFVGQGQNVLRGGNTSDDALTTPDAAKAIARVGRTGLGRSSVCRR